MIQNGNNIYGYITLCNGAILIPEPNNPNNIFLFHLGIIPGSGSGGNLLYSLINNSIGTWCIATKNSLLNDSLFTERILAVKHANGRDWWIIGRLWWTDKFVTYLLEPQGLAGPNYQSIGSPDTFFYDGGQMVSNRAGDKVVMADNNGTLELFDFDRCTGQFSNYNPLYIATTQLQKWRMFYGCSFSPGGRYLYVSTYDSLLQFDLNASNILNSQITIFQTSDSNYVIGQHAFAPDGKIYVANHSMITNITDSLNTHLGVIDDPDQPGVLCDFQPYSFSLGGKRSFFGLPNLPNFSLGPVSGSICDSLSATSISDAPKIEQSLKISPQPASGFIALSFDQPVDENLVCRITDNLGSTKLMSNETSKSGLYRLDLSMIPTGLYTLEVTTKNGQKLFKKLLVVK